MLLRDSLGAGNSKTMVIVALNPALAQIVETKRSLEFAQKAVWLHPFLIFYNYVEISSHE
ncbi:hypothetical protein KIN20_034384 [Parelaphostrongylus tenuis]|uniref:Kinesin motor domain-containing protein n=1 Tax=Parelaphostrongylus tenuis TaxID=148309 RepID=A0AAD5WJN9_PARTN|nr:hypothetical protein KIN20_034384 [Parelaphostrongylus tenuis]